MSQFSSNNDATVSGRVEVRVGSPEVGEPQAMLTDLDCARNSHLEWAEHLESHVAAGIPCKECDSKPYKLNAAHEREWVAKYDRLIAFVRGANVELTRLRADLARERTAHEDALNFIRGIGKKMANAGYNDESLYDDVDRLISVKRTAEADLAQWRTWAQFVYGDGGPVQGTDAELRARVCESHDADTEQLKADLARVTQERDALRAAGTLP